jgi:protein-S-isoprenylcysteine O-methyltransferase
MWFIYAFWVILVVYLTVTAFSAKRDTKTHLGQSFGLLFAIIAAFLLPHLSIFQFVNFAPVNLTLNIIGAVLCTGGIIFLVWARQTLGKNWSQTVSAKQGHELVTKKKTKEGRSCRTCLA